MGACLKGRIRGLSSFCTLLKEESNMEGFSDGCRVTDVFEGLVEGLFADDSTTKEPSRTTTTKKSQSVDTDTMPKNLRSTILDEIVHLKVELASTKTIYETKFNVADELVSNLEDRLSHLESKISAIESSMLAIDKTRRIEWALSLIRESETNSGFPSMTIPFPPGSYSLGDSNFPMTTADDFIRLALLSFRKKNEGTAIPHDFYELVGDRTVSALSESERAAARQRFRDTVVLHLYNLLGFEPRVTQEANRQWFIYCR